MISRSEFLEFCRGLIKTGKMFHFDDRDEMIDVLFDGREANEVTRILQEADEADFDIFEVALEALNEQR